MNTGYGVVQQHINSNYSYSKCTQIFNKHRNHLRTPGAKRAIRSKFHTEVPQKLGAAVRNLVFAPT